MKKILQTTFVTLLIAAVFFSQKLAAQPQQFTVTVTDTANISSVPDIHSNAFARYNGKWIFIGGRTQGISTVAGTHRCCQIQICNRQAR